MQTEPHIAHPKLGRGRQLGLKPGDALIAVDVQQDFLPGGALGVPRGEEVIQPLNAYIAAFHARHLPIFLTRDWHPQNHCSFNSHGGPWPPHCVQHSTGAEWAAHLHAPDSVRIVSKGMNADQEAYSAFADPALVHLLRELDVKRLFVGGLATDYCVHATVLDARAQGFEVVVLADAVRGINATPGDETRALREMLEHGATLTQWAH